MTTLMKRLRDSTRAIKQDTLALYLAARDPRTPLAAKMIAMAVAAYALSPIDLIPDFIPVLGYLDDLLIVPLGIAAAVKLIPHEVMEECRNRAAQEFAGGVVKSRTAAFVIVAIWVAAIALVVFPIVRGTASR